MKPGKLQERRQDDKSLVRRPMTHNNLYYYYYYYYLFIYLFFIFCFFFSRRLQVAGITNQPFVRVSFMLAKSKRLLSTNLPCSQ